MSVSLESIFRRIASPCVVWLIPLSYHWALTQSHSCPYSSFTLPFNTPDDKKYTPNCFSRQAETKGGSNALLGFTNIKRSSIVSTNSYSPISTSFIDSRNELMSFLTQGGHVERSLNAPVALSLNE